MKRINKTIHKLLPRSVDKWIRKVIFNTYRWGLIKSKHNFALKRIREKNQIKVVFFALHAGVWKYDRLYNLMLEHPNFEPSVLVCPVINYGRENMLKEMDICYKMLKDKNYKVSRSYNIKENIYLNVKETINPDIIFYTNPYSGIIDDRYYITNFPDILTCYVPYSSMIIQSNTQFNKHLCNFLWKSFVENSYSFDMSKKYMTNKGKNVVVSGFPSLDVLLDKSYQPKKVWKNDQKIKIIWAPHHTIEGTESINFATFLQFSDFMVELTKKYQEYIQVAFKPHPLLYVKLCKIWGNDKTEEYYTKWEEMSNTQLETGDYIDLFLTSDAMIFDSCSFLNEYLYTKKPSAFITNDIVQQQLNDYGLDAFNCHQHVRTEEDITNFIESLKNNNPDPLSAEKDSYYKKYISMFEEESASERILSEIINSIYKSRN